MTSSKNYILTRDNYTFFAIYTDKFHIYSQLKLIKQNVWENKLLKKLIITELEHGKVDFVQIEYFFPGKRSETIRKEVGKLLLQL